MSAVLAAAGAGMATDRRGTSNQGGKTQLHPFSLLPDIVLDAYSNTINHKNKFYQRPRNEFHMNRMA